MVAERKRRRKDSCLYDPAPGFGWMYGWTGPNLGFQVAVTQFKLTYEKWKIGSLNHTFHQLPPSQKQQANSLKCVSYSVWHCIGLLHGLKDCLSRTETSWSVLDCQLSLWGSNFRKVCWEIEWLCALCLNSNRRQYCVVVCISKVKKQRPKERLSDTQGTTSSKSEGH